MVSAEMGQSVFVHERALVEPGHASSSVGCACGRAYCWDGRRLTLQQDLIYAAE
jgi:hypothetical protein